MGVFAYWGGGTVQEVFLENLPVEKFVRFVLTNSPFFYSHLWFLYALIYSYGTLYIIGPKLISKRWKPVYAILALLTFTLFSEVLPTVGVQRSFTSFHIGIHNFFGLRALPFIVIGLILRENTYKIQTQNDYTQKRNITAIVVFAVISIIERFAFVDSQFYIGSYAMVVLILICCIRNPDCFSNVLRYIGKKLSLYVYVIQYAIIEILDFLSGKIVPQQFTLMFAWLKPVLCIFLALTLSVIITKVHEKLTVICREIIRK